MFVALGRAERGGSRWSAALDAWNEQEPDHWAVADAARLAAVRADRAAAAAEWFESHAGRMGRDPLASCRRRCGRGGDGRGAGRRAGRHADRYRHGHRADAGAVRAHARRRRWGSTDSSEMLRLARAKLSERGVANAELRQADLYALPMHDGGGGCRDPAPCAPFRAAAGGRDRRGGAGAGAGWAAADRGLRDATTVRNCARGTRIPGWAFRRCPDGDLVRSRRIGCAGDRDARGRRTHGQIVAGAQACQPVEESGARLRAVKAA